MRMPILDMLRLGNIIHSAHRAVARFFTPAAFAVHGADISRGVFFALAMLCLGSGCIMVMAIMRSFRMSGVMIMVTVIMSTIAPTGPGKQSHAEQ